MRIVLFIFLAVSTASFTHQPDTYVVPISGDGFTAKVEAYISEKQIKTKPHLTYHWLKSKKIFTTTGGYSGLLLHGSYISHYTDGALLEKGFFKNGLKNGNWQSWHQNGKTKEVTSYKSGQLHGAFEKFNENGQLIARGNFKNGKRHGLYVVYENDKVVSEQTYKNGIEIAPKLRKVPKEALKSEKDDKGSDVPKEQTPKKDKKSKGEKTSK